MVIVAGLLDEYGRLLNEATTQAAARVPARWTRRGRLLGRRESDQSDDLGAGVPVHHELDLSLVDLGRGSVGGDAARRLARRTDEGPRAPAVTDPGSVWIRV
jgi:hypothetical protein